MVVGLIILAAISLGLAAHPFVTYPASLLLLRRWARVAVRTAAPGPGPGAETGVAAPRVALCFCAYNEADVIGDKIANLRALRARMPELSIHCFVDGASD